VSKLNELKEQVAKERKELSEMFNSADVADLDADKKTDIADRTKGLNDLVEKVSELENLEAEKARNEKALESLEAPVDSIIPAQAGAPVEKKSIGEQFAESDVLAAYHEKGLKGVDARINMSAFEMKTLLTTTGYPPESLRAPGIIETDLRDPESVIGLFSVITTNQNAYPYLKESTFTNNAAEAAEGGAYGEAALAFTETTESIRKFAISLPVTDELLGDVSALRGYVDTRLRLMLRLRLDSQLLSGDGTAPNIEGILDAGKTNVNAIDFSSYAGTLGRVGAIYQAITDIRANSFLEPDAIIMHPNDWNQVVTSVASDFAGTSSAGYTETSPLFVQLGGMASGVPANIWGLPVVPTTAIAEGTVLVGKFGGGVAAHIVMRDGVDIAVSDSHDDFFTKGKLMLRAQIRLGFTVYREEAFTKITNY
jgi:HK97 family phage major capsid protein